SRHADADRIAVDAATGASRCGARGADIFHRAEVAGGRRARGTRSGSRVTGGITARATFGVRGRSATPRSDDTHDGERRHREHPAVPILVAEHDQQISCHEVTRAYVGGPPADLRGED